MTIKMLVVTNRRLRNQASTNQSMFGEKPNSNGPAETRLAWAEKVGKVWVLSLINEPKNMTIDNVPSRNAFREFKKSLNDSKQNCVFYMHGYNKKFVESLEQGWKLQSRYGVGVVLFSWASNPGGIAPFEYPKARAIARSSSPALDMTLEKLGRYMCEELDQNCNISVNLLTHSLGVYLFKCFIEKPLFTGETRIFDNIILHQADVDSKGHKSWVSKLRFARRVYATINEKDKILDISDIVNPDRLGNTSKNLKSKNTVYFDFTNAFKVKKTHQLFGSYTSKNPVAFDFFKNVLNGEDGESVAGLNFNHRKNAYDVS